MCLDKEHRSKIRHQLRNIFSTDTTNPISEILHHEENISNSLNEVVVEVEKEQETKENNKESEFAVVADVTVATENIEEIETKASTSKRSKR